MEIIQGTTFMKLALAFALIAYLFYKYLTRNFEYWKNKGIVYVEPKLPFSKKTEIEKDSYRATSMYNYNKYKNERFVGTVVMTYPELIVTDLDLIKHILTKDFHHFVDRGMLPNLPHDFLVKHLVHMQGDEWKLMRSKLTPTFTSGKMRLYFNLIENITKQLTDYLEPLAKTNSTVEVKDLLARFTTDVISTCAFGLEVNSIKDPENQIRQMGIRMLARSKRDFLAAIIYPHVPWLTKIFPLTHTKPEVAEFILKLLTDTVEYRKKNSVVRNDFIDLLMKIKDKRSTLDKDEKEDGEYTYQNTNRTSSDNEGLTLKEMAAQMSVFFAAGFETASSTTTFLLYELALNQDIQDKLRKEIDTVINKNDGEFTYQCLQEMHYLEKCIYETLRRYASLPFLSRVCTKTYKLPGTDLVIDEGVKINIPIYPIHHDPEYYPDPYKFDPERFSAEAINSRHQYTFLPFGEGPRVCIGKRMGFMQVQLAAVTLLRHYELKLAPGIPTVLPISPTDILTTSEIPVEVVISKRQL